MSSNLEIIDLNDDSDVEIVGGPNDEIDTPDIIDINSLKNLLSEDKEEELNPAVEKIVKKLLNDVEFEKECDKLYKANLEVDVQVVQFDIKKELARNESVKLSEPLTRIKALQKIPNDKNLRMDLHHFCSKCMLSKHKDYHLVLRSHFVEKHHMVKGKYICPFCPFIDNSYLVVQDHTLQKHKLSRTEIKCRICPFSTFRQDTFNDHCKMHRNRSLRCTEKGCPFVAMNGSGLKNHLRLKHLITLDGQKIFNCDLCDTFKTPSLTIMKKHKSFYCLKNKHRIHSCTECKYRTLSLDALNDHNLRSHPKSEILFCKYCDYSTTQNKELNNHIERIHSEKN